MPKLYHPPDPSSCGLFASLIPTRIEGGCGNSAPCFFHTQAYWAAEDFDQMMVFNILCTKFPFHQKGWADHFFHDSSWTSFSIFKFNDHFTPKLKSLNVRDRPYNRLSEFL